MLAVAATGIFAHPQSIDAILVARRDSVPSRVQNVAFKGFGDYRNARLVRGLAMQHIESRPSMSSNIFAYNVCVFSYSWSNMVGCLLPAIREDVGR